MSRKWSLRVAILMPVLMAGLLVLLATSEKQECETGFREYSLKIGLPEEPAFILAETGQQATSVSVKGCIPDAPDLTDELVDQVLYEAARMTVSYSIQVEQFPTKEEGLLFFTNGFGLLIKQKYPLFFATRNTALEFEMETQEVPATPTPQGRTA